MNYQVAPKHKKAIAKALQNKIILVTGGTGSFGKTIVRELLQYKPKEIRVYSRGEDKQDRMRFSFPQTEKINYILGDVRDYDQVHRAMKGVDIVFHAAAQKQVPATEYNVYEAVKTNIIGTQNIVDACIACGVKIAIGISTDKAVEPVNAMGMTKALEEKLFISGNVKHQGGVCKFSCVRYGNVLGSTGSVFEVFQKQLASGTSLTITNDQMTRFLITMEQAVNLVFTALINTVGGETFIPDLPTHYVLDMARALQKMYNGKIQGKPITIKSIGVRVGEKIHESLISPTESLRTVKKDDYYVVLPQIHIAAIEKAYKIPKNAKGYRFSSDTAKMLTVAQLETILTKHTKIHGGI
jgi:UDP-glucose 4-epimerase